MNYLYFLQNIIELNPILCDAIEKLLLPIVVFTNWYGIIFIIYKIQTNNYNIFLAINPNLIKPESKYFRSYQFWCTVHNFNSLPNLILLIVGLIQFFQLGKAINVGSFFLLLLIDIFQADIRWKKDISIHRKNDIYYIVERTSKSLVIQASQIQIGDIIKLNSMNQKVCPVPLAIYIGKDTTVFDDTPISGEKKMGEIKNGLSIVLEQEILQPYDCSFHIEKVGLEIKPETQSNNALTELISMNTMMALFQVLIIILGVYLLESTESILILITIRVFIGVNQLFPSFKLTLGLKTFFLVYDLKCKNNGFEVKKQLYSQNKYIVFSDKTGTLTVPYFKVSTESTITKEYIPLLLAHITGFKINGENWNDCMELKSLMKFMEENFQVTFGDKFISNEYNGIINNTYRHTYHPFSYQYNGVHSLIEMDGKYYHCISGNLAFLSNRFNYTRVSISPLRGWMFAAIILPNRDAFNSSRNKFMNDNNEMIDKFIPLAEVYFENPYRTFKQHTTEDGIKEITQKYPFIMCTGDSLETANAIADDLGITGPHFDTKQFFMLSKENKKLQFENIIKNKGGVFACAKPEQKNMLVILAKEFYPKRCVIFCGDQDNDLMAIKSCDFSVGQMDGCNPVKSISSIVAMVPAAALAMYLKSYKNWGTDGVKWFMMIYTIFANNCASAFLIGIYNKNFANNYVLYNDPWSPALSLPMSTVMLILCILVSMWTVVPPCNIKPCLHKHRSNNMIVYIGPLVSFFITLIINFILVIYVPYIAINYYTMAPFIIILETLISFIII